MTRLIDLARIALAFSLILVAARAVVQTRAAQAAWESTNHCVVIGYSDPGVYQTNPRRALLGCDCGLSLRPTI